MDLKNTICILILLSMLTACRIVFPSSSTPSPTIILIPMTPTPTATPLPPTPEFPRGLIWHYQDATLYTGDGTPYFELDDNQWIPVVTDEIAASLSANSSPVLNNQNDWVLLNVSGDSVWHWNMEDSVWIPSIPYDILISMSTHRQPIKGISGDWTILNDRGEDVWQWNMKELMWIPIVPQGIAARLPSDTVPVMDDAGEWYILDLDEIPLLKWSKQEALWVPLIPENMVVLISTDAQPIQNKSGTWVILDDKKEELYYWDSEFLLWAPTIPQEVAEILPFNTRPMLDKNSQWLLQGDSEFIVFQWHGDIEQWLRKTISDREITDKLGISFPADYLSEYVNDSLEFRVLLSKSLMEGKGIDKIHIPSSDLAKIGRWMMGAIVANQLDEDSKYMLFSEWMKKLAALKPGPPHDKKRDTYLEFNRIAVDIIKQGPIKVTFYDYGSDSHVSGFVSDIRIIIVLVQEFEAIEEFLISNQIGFAKAPIEDKNYHLAIIDGNELVVLVASQEKGKYFKDLLQNQSIEMGFGTPQATPRIWSFSRHYFSSPLASLALLSYENIDQINNPLMQVFDDPDRQNEPFKGMPYSYLLGCDMPWGGCLNQGKYYEGCDNVAKYWFEPYIPNPPNSCQE